MASVKLLVIAGPTATGKSEVAVEVAKAVGGEIVNADSVQIYKYCNIGTAKPPLELRREVPHYLYDVLEPDQEFNAGEYEKLAETMVLSIHKRGKIPIIVGGTGLYIKALLWGLSVPASRDNAVRERLEEEWREDPGAMYHRLQEADPQYADKISPKDRVRVVRALEILELTGSPPSQFSNWGPKMWLKPFTVALDLPRELLKQKIDQRTELMVKKGLVEETEGILSMGYPKTSPPLQAIGYKQAIQYLEGKLSLEDMKNAIKKATWNYSKRQRAWFKKEGFKWICGESRAEAVMEICRLWGDESG